MKKYLYSAMIALFAMSCSEKEELLDEITPDIPLNAPESLYAEIPHAESRAIWNTEIESWDKSASVNSRTYAVIDGMNEEGLSTFKQLWHPGDAISLFTTTQNLKYVLSSGDKNDFAQFELDSNTNSTSGQELTTDFYYSVYPYKDGSKDREQATTITPEGQVTFCFPEMQEYAQNSYAQGYNGMIAREPIEGTDGVYEFKNFCSYLQLSLTYSDSSKEVDRIILKANNHHDLISGIGTITYDESENTNEETGFDNAKPVVSMIHELSSNEVALDCRKHQVKLDPETPTNFWFVLPGDFTFSNGFNVTIIFKDGSYFKKETKKNISIERNHIKPMATFPIETVMESCIRYKYEEPICFESGDEYKFPFKVDENGYCIDFTNENNQPLKIIYHEYDEITKEWVVQFDGILNNIEDNTFDNNNANNLASITIQNCETIDIKGYAFWNCTAEEITIKNDISTIQDNALSRSNVQEINVVGDIYEIWHHAGKATKYPFDFNVQGHIHTICNGAFDSSKITSITATERIIEIEDKAFYECEYLESIDLETIEIIGHAAFQCCYNLQQVTIGENCTRIGEGAFTACDLLDNIIIKAMIPPFLDSANTPQDGPYIFPDYATIYVPDVTTYQNAEPWWWYYNKNLDYISNYKPQQ